MKILFIGNINGLVFLNEHAKWLKEKLGPSTSIDVFSIVPYDKKGQPNIGSFGNKYFAHTNSILSRIPGFKRYIIMPIRFLLLPNDYDVIQVQYVFPFLKTISPFFRLKAKKVIVTFWGSDFYKVGNRTKRMIANRILTKADAITMGNPGVIDDFTAHFGSRFKNLQLCIFGNDSIEIFKSMEQIPKATSKTFFQLSPNKIAITIGYNASDNNQHLSILNAIEAFEPLLKFKDKIEFIIPFTYGGTERYMQAIRERLKRFQFNFKVIELYQPMNQLFHLRNASDVFIHLPLSDSISGSLREYLISKNIVITGNWLPYKILDQNEIYYQSIDHLNKLSEILFKSLSNIEIEQLNCSDNPTKMYKISSWNMVIENWITLYNNLIEDNKYTNLPN